MLIQVWFVITLNGLVIDLGQLFGIFQNLIQKNNYIQKVFLIFLRN